MIDRNRMTRFIGFALIAWGPAAVGVVLAGAEVAWPLVVLVTFGGLGAAAVLAARISRVPARMKVPSTAVEHAGSWAAIANPDGQYANRWASYADFFEILSGRDWAGSKVAEIGGSNEVLRAMLPGAVYQQLAYPEYDAQNLPMVANGSFDVVVLDQTLEHIVDPERALREMHRILVDGGTAVISTPFLVPVHEGEGYGDYYRWTPTGLKIVLERCGFDAEVRSWGNKPAATALMDDMYLMTGAARKAGLAVDVSDGDPEYPVTVWAVARKRRQ